MRLFTILCMAAVSAFAFPALATIPQGYYSRATGKAKSELKTALHEIINPHIEVSSYSALPSYFQKTDLYPQSKQWWDMYGNEPFYAPSFKGLNREHSFPKSWWGGDDNIPPYVDLFHLYPAESAANMAKSNYPLGTVTGIPTFDNGVSTVGKGINSGGAPYVYEPDDDYKGDFARTYFYMVTCYQDLTWKYQYMARNGAYPTLQSWAIDLLLDWHRNDPVSQKELDRNEAVYKIQNNRNPFIDYPELAEYIWGKRMGESFVPSTGQDPTGEPKLTAPVQDMTLDFNDVAINRRTTSRMYFKGENLVGSLELSLSGADAKYFTLDTKMISASLPNSDNGYWLAVTYTPTELGEHTARLRVQDGGLVGSIGIELRGNCLPTPVLTAPVATAPTDITSDSYTANWTPAEDEVVDYYVVTRTKFRNGNSSVEEIIAEENNLPIDGFNESDTETYSVQSVRLGYKSAPSNTITVGHSAIVTPDADILQWVVETFEEGLVRITTAATLRNVAVYEPSGRLIRLIPEVESSIDFTLPAGIYMITADGATPRKLVIK